MNTKQAALVAMALAVGLSVAGAAAQDKPARTWTIALSNGYYGNAWRHQMVKSFEEAASQAKKEGRIKDYYVLNADGTVNQQSAQLSDLILRHVNAILINANSETALNGIISKACARGIKVISFDSIVSAPCAWRLGFDYDEYGALQAEAAADVLKGKGNVLIVRGVKGSAPDEHIYAGQMSVLKKHLDMKVVATIYGGASGPIAQAAVAGVIPTVSRIDAVLAQGGGDDIGIAQAFEQAGGQYATAMPFIAGGGSAEFIHWWEAQHEAHGYSTVSVSSAPSAGGAVVWYALAILNGANPPKTQNLPLVKLTDADLGGYRNLPPGNLASPTYPESEVLDLLVKRK